MLRNEFYTEKADVYSFAIVIWECLTRQDPFAGMPPFHVVFVVGSQGARPEVPPLRPEWPAPLLDLMVHAWQEDPNVRPSFHDIIISLQEMMEGFGGKDSAVELAAESVGDVASPISSDPAPQTLSNVTTIN